MPELPEVEVVRQGLEKAFAGKVIKEVIVRQPRLRWPISEEIFSLSGKKILAITRRAKYLLISFTTGTLIIHLGMSGRFSESPLQSLPEKHDHVDFIFAKNILRYNDPRRFGCMLWSAQPLSHPLLTHLGPEPFDEAFSLDYFYAVLLRSKKPIKPLLMNAQHVVGVGNIYASEALFRAKIHPQKLACSLDKKACRSLMQAIRVVLSEAIAKGGSTLKDHQLLNGETGYFQHAFKVYGRAQKPCLSCGTLIEKIIQSNRSTFFCPRCQPS